MTPQELKALRQDQGWSQEDIARIAGVSLNIVKRWESGQKHLTPRKVKLIKEATKPVSSPHWIVVVVDEVGDRRILEIKAPNRESLTEIIPEGHRVIAATPK